MKGIVSPGMLCAEDELGLGDDHTRASSCSTPTTRIALGRRLRAGKLGLADEVLEVNAPANRGDVLGHLGVARELAALARRQARAAGRCPALPHGGAPAKVELVDAERLPALHRAR